jgi:hypothetical protein
MAITMYKCDDGGELEFSTIDFTATAPSVIFDDSIFGEGLWDAPEETTKDTLHINMTKNDNGTWAIIMMKIDPAAYNNDPNGYDFSTFSSSFDVASNTLTLNFNLQANVQAPKDYAPYFCNYSGAKLGNISKESKILMALLIPVSITDLITAKV